MSDQKPLPFVYQFMAGAVAGVSEILVMYPLDFVKTVMQLQVAGTGPQYKGVFDCLKQIAAKEGVGRLYKGISSPIMMEAPKRATKFACNDEFQKIYKKLFNEEKLTQPISLLSGASAGICESFVVVPFELVKIRLQDVSSKYSGPMEVVKDILKKEGPAAMYNGLESTIWRHGIWNAGYFGIIFQVRALLPTAQTKSQQTRNDLLAGTIGGTISSLASTPFDVVKSRVQNTLPGEVRKYNWSLPSLGLIYKEEGFKALYKGFVPKVLRLGPGGGILLVVFTGVMDFFRSIQP